MDISVILLYLRGKPTKISLQYYRFMLISRLAQAISLFAINLGGVCWPSDECRSNDEVMMA